MNDKASVRNVFSVRNFRLVFFGALVSEIGSVLYSFAVSFLILDLTGNNAFLQGLYLALGSVVLLLVTPIGGILSDRYNKSRIMAVCDGLSGIVIILATLGMYLFTSPRVQLIFLFAVGILGNLLAGLFTPASGSLLPLIVEEEQFQQANAYNSARSSLQSILGVVLAGILYAAIPVKPLFLIVGSCYLISGISETFIHYDHHSSGGKLTLKLALGDMKDGFHYVTSQKALLVLMAAIMFVNFFIDDGRKHVTGFPDPVVKDPAGKVRTLRCPLSGSHCRNHDHLYVQLLAVCLREHFHQRHSDHPVSVCPDPGLCHIKHQHSAEYHIDEDR